MTISQRYESTGRDRVGAGERSASRDWWPLLRLIVLLAAAGAALYATAGPPRPPDLAPDLQLVLATLRGTSIPLDAVGYVLTSLAWLIWGWLVVSLVARLIVAFADLATRGAAWVGSLRRMTNAFTLPVVRRAVDSALAVAIVAQVVARPGVVGAAELPRQPSIVQTVGETTAAVRLPSARMAVYDVQRGDTLWSIAERFYGTGHEYQRLVEANVGHEVGPGARFPETGVIEPGWQLRVPLPSTALEDEDGQAVYSVERGDTLWGISARFLGDPLRWHEIYESNQETASLPDGRTLRNPDLIWPELRLRLPMAVEAVDAPSEVVAAPLPVAGPAVETEPRGQVEQVARVDAGLGTVAGGFAGAGAAGAVAAALIARRRGRRGLDEPPVGDEPESDFIVRGGFADLDDSSRAVGPEEVAAQEALRYFDERGLEGRVGLVSVRHGRSSTTLAIVAQRLADRPHVMEAAAGLATRLGVEVRTQLSRDHDVLVRLGALRRARFGGTATAATAPVTLLPMGVLPDRRVLHVNWPASGHMLLAGHGRGAVATLLASTLATLAVRSKQEALQLVAFARGGALPSSLERLPQLAGRFVDPSDAVSTTAAMHDVRAELVRRMERVERGGSVATLPELVIVAAELELLAREHLSTLDMIGSYGALHRVRLVASSARSNELPDTLLAHFASRAVLRVRDEHESTRLLGTAAATDLLGGGQMLVRLDEREPLEAYAFRVSEAELDRCVRALRGEPTPVRGMEVVRPEPAWSERVDVDETDEVEERARLTVNGHTPLLDFSTRVATSVEVRCFGGFDVVAGARDLTAASSPGEAAERAPAWEVLAYLSCQPEGVAPREDVLLALWPSLETRQAAAALTAAIERLNGLLQPALAHYDVTMPPLTLDSRDGVCRLDLNRVESDVHRFMRLCRAASLMPAGQAVEAWAHARELYRGDLLDGPGARDYAWVSAPAEEGELSMRDWLREQYYRATLRRARLLMHTERYADAVPLFQSLLDVEPLLEDVVRDLFRCHAALGDLHALVTEEERLRTALHRFVGPDEDPDPEPATMALFASLRSDLELKASVTA